MLLIDQRVVCLFPQKSVSKCDMWVSEHLVKLRRHTRIFACLKVLSSEREAAYSLYDNIPTPSANREEKFDAMHVTMVIIFLDLNNIVFFRDGYLYC